MPLLEDLEDAFSVAKHTPYDMSSTDSKLIRKRMSDYCWRFLAPYRSGKPPWFDNPDYTEFFNVKELQYAARIYELMWFANFAYIAEEEPGLLEYAARRLEAEGRTGNVPTRSNLILRGCVEYRRKNNQLAKHFISRAHSELIPDSVISPFFAYSRSTCLFEESSEVRGDPAIGVSHENAWILVAGDADYIIKYLPNYLNSLVETNAHEDGFGGIHVRVMRAGVGTNERFAEVEKVLDTGRQLLGNGFETSYVTVPDVRDKRSWFAAERFLHARSLLADKGRLVITDLDYGVRIHPKSFLAWSEEFDLCGLLARDNEFKSFFPWLKVQAGTVVVSNSRIGKLFLDYFEKYFTTAFVGSSWNWGIDQNALANALDNLDGASAIGNINDVRNHQPFFIPRALKRS